MARAGITKYSVEKARNNLISKGINPSIDAIRVELGNTGSKTTISRYLKELEADESVQLEDEALLSEGIKEVISSLARKLHDEANEIVAKSQSHTEETIRRLKTEAIDVRQKLKESQETLEREKAKSNTQAQSIDALNSEIEQLRSQLIELSSHNQELKSIILEKDEQILSLKQNHQHSRESLEHYRTSVKDQREQEQRQHEQQIQHLQAESRQLNQTLIVKQSELTQLNKDNSRLVTEAVHLQKTNLELRGYSDKVEQELALDRETVLSQKGEIDNLASRLKSYEDKYQAISEQSLEFQKDIKTKSIRLTELETELRVKSELIDTLNINGTSTDNQKPGLSN